MLKTLFFALFGLLAFNSPFHPNSIFVRADGIQDLSKVELKVGNVLKPHPLQRLSSGEQGSDSVVFKLSNGYNGIPAVLKAMQDKGSNVADIKKEIEYANRVGVALTDTIVQRSGVNFYCLVMKDLRDGNPPLKFFHDWYFQDQSIILSQELPALRKLAKETFLAFAEKYDLLYFDVHLTNFLVDRKLTKLQPLDFSPPRYVRVPGLDQPTKMSGVEDIKGLKREERNLRMREYEEHLRLALRKRAIMSLDTFYAVVTDQFKAELRPMDQQAYRANAIY